jgi:hypothetical protein
MVNRLSSTRTWVSGCLVQEPKVQGPAQGQEPGIWDIQSVHRPGQEIEVYRVSSQRDLGTGWPTQEPWNYRKPWIRFWSTGCPGIEPGIQGVQHKSLEYRVAAQESGLHGVDHKKTWDTQGLTDRIF